MELCIFFFKSLDYGLPFPYLEMQVSPKFILWFVPTTEMMGFFQTLGHGLLPIHSWPYSLVQSLDYGFSLQTEMWGGPRCHRSMGVG